MIAIFVLKHARMVLVFRECKHIKNIFEDVYFTKNSFHITLTFKTRTKNKIGFRLFKSTM